MKKLRFYFALWGGKFYVFLLKLFKKEKNDRPGVAALKVCPDFLSLINKPKLVIGVTGTNGKTTTTNLIAELLIKDNKKAIYNDWGANTKASHARCLFDGVTIFNKVKKDVAVLEVDEKSTGESTIPINFNYFIVTNLFRDSIYRNAHTEYIFNQINNYLPKKATIILNSDDPISSELNNKESKIVYYGIEKQKIDLLESINIIQDFRICPKCNEKITYNYLRYHHIGNYYCPKCNYKSKESTYLGTDIDLNKLTMNVLYKNKKLQYPLISDMFYNAYNVLAIIALFNEMGMDYNKLCNYLKDLKVVKRRYSTDTYNNIEINTISTKGLNAVAVSRSFDYVANIKGNKALIMVYDDTFDRINGSENISWIFETDFELLNRPDIKQIIVGGVRSLDYKVRLLQAGIPSDKIICIEDEQDTSNYIDFNNIDKIFIMHEVYYYTNSLKIKEQLIKRLNKEVQK